MDRDSTTFDLLAAARSLRQRALLIVLCFALTAAVAFAYSKHQHKEYTGTAQVLFRDAQLDQQVAGLPSVSTDSPQAQTDTNLRLATLPRVAAETAAVIGRGLSPADVAAAITVNQIGDTDLASVSATWESPSIAARIANTYAAHVVADRQHADVAYYALALRAVNLQLNALTSAQQRGLQGTDLMDRAASLQILSQLQASDAQVVQQASAPDGASSPKVIRNTALGAMLGLLLGIGLALILHRLDDRIREPSDLEQVYGVPLVGVVPESSTLALRGKGSPAPLPPSEAEVFGLIHAHIRYFNVDRDLRLVAIVSAAPAEGKTTIARHLSVAAATVGLRVVFIEADLRRPAAAKHFGTDAEPGLSEVLVGAISLADAVQKVELATHKGLTIGLDVLVAGGVLPPNPAQVIESRAMESVLDEARDLYDLVIVDTPPLAVVPDAFPLLRRADGVLIVSRLGRQGRDVAARLRDTLASANAPVIGVVANGFERPRAGSPGGYAYVYGYDDSPSKDDRATGALVASNGSPAAAQSAAGDPAGSS